MYRDFMSDLLFDSSRRITALALSFVAKLQNQTSQVFVLYSIFTLTQQYNRTMFDYHFEHGKYNFLLQLKQKVKTR